MAKDSPTTGEKIVKHRLARGGKWFCSQCRSCHDSPEKFGDRCAASKGSCNLAGYQYTCRDCPRACNDMETFLKEPCNQERAIEREKQRKALLAKIKEESKKQEKLKIMKRLDDERERLQRLMAQQKGQSILA